MINYLLLLLLYLLNRFQFYTLPISIKNKFSVIYMLSLSCVRSHHFSTDVHCFSLITWTGTPCFRGHGRRNGERRRKSVRGCIVSPDLSVLNLVIVKKGENDLPGLTDLEKPRMRGPKRASKIRKLFNLSKDDDVRKYVNTYRRTFTTKDGKISYPCNFSISCVIGCLFIKISICGCDMIQLQFAQFCFFFFLLS